MIAFIDDHRSTYGVEPICPSPALAVDPWRDRIDALGIDGAADRPVDLPRACGAACRSGPGLASRPAGPDAHGADPAGACGQRRGIRRPQGLAAARPGRHRGGPLHGGTPDATDGSAWRRQGQGDQDHDRRQGLALPGGQGEPPVPGAAAECSASGALAPAAAQSDRP